MFKNFFANYTDKTMETNVILVGNEGEIAPPTGVFANEYQ